MASTGDETVEDEEDYYEYEDDEEDYVHSMNEQAKEQVRRQLREMKAIYRSIIQRNKEIPEEYRVRQDELKLPSEIYASIHKRIDTECDEVYRIHEYESAETLVQLEKIKANYIEPLEVDHVVVKDISHIVQIHTMRIRQITKDFDQLIVKNQAQILDDHKLLHAYEKAQEVDSKEKLDPVKRIYAEEIIGEYESKIHTYDIETIHSIRHLETRLQQRYERECAWQDLMEKKIPQDFIPPEDAETLARAKADTGAFQLQTSENYLGEQISVAERRQKILDMKVKIRENVSDFNRMVLEARDEKPRVLEECRRLEKEIRKMHVLLPEEYRRKIPPIYDIEPEENPERVFDITQEDVEAEEQAMLAAAGLLSIQDDIMEEYFGVKKPEKPEYIEEEAFVPQPAAGVTRQAKTIDLEHESVASHRCRKQFFNPQTEIEKKRFEVVFYPRLYRQEMLFKDLIRVIEYFHERIKYIHDQRIRLEIDLKVKTVSMMTMINELDIAKEFDTHEKAILERLRAQQAECKDAKFKLDKIKKKQIKASGEVKRFEQEVGAISKEVEIAIGGKGRYFDYLWRVFKKKVKAEADDEDDEEMQLLPRNLSSSSDSTDASDSTSQDSGSELFKLPKQKMDVNLCPKELDRGLYNKVIDLRTKKNNLEIEIEATKKHADMIHQDFIAIDKVYQKFEGRITNISEEIRVLQRRRQKRMNDLKIMVILRADQIQCTDMDEVAEIEGDILDKLAQTFPGIGNIVIFPKGGGNTLEHRATELDMKAKEEKIRYKKGKQMLFRLRQELKTAEKEVEALKALVKKEMIMKYGQEVDLDRVTAAVINLELLDQQNQLDKMKAIQYKERAKVSDEVDEVKYTLTKKIQENSKYNMMKALMMERKRDLDYYIWKHEKASVTISEDGEMEEVKKFSMELESSGDGDGSGSLETHEKIEKVKSELRSIDSSCISQTELYSKIQEDIDHAKGVLRQQNQRMLDLREVLRRCRSKSGLPPLIPICQDFEPLPKKTKTKGVCPKKTVLKYTKPVKQLPELNQYCPEPMLRCGVQTIYNVHDKFTGDARKEQSFTHKSMQNVDQAAEDETSIIFPQELEYNNDYYTDDEDEDLTAGGAAAIREFQEGIAEFPPENEEELLQFLAETEFTGKAGQKAAEVKAGQEAAEVKAGQEAAEGKAGQEAAEVKAGQEAAEVKAGQEAAEVKDGQEEAKVKPDEDIEAKLT